MHERLLLNEKELAESLPLLITEAQTRVVLVSCFLKCSALAWIDRVIPSGVSVEIVTRWRKEDLLTGSSDIEAYEFARDRSWSLAVDLNLHAKAILIDTKTLIIGSSNYTSRGLGLSSNSNHEINFLVKPTSGEADRIRTYFSNARIITKEIYEKLLTELELTESQIETPNWSVATLNALKIDNTTVWPTECLIYTPAEYRKLPVSYNTNDSKLWGDDGPNPITAKRMKIFLWLDEILKSEDRIFRFGEITSLLHDAMINDPKPYRKDIKLFVSALFSWCEELNLHNVVQFNHTKGIRY